MAWHLCTAPDEKARDGKRAVEAATKACELTEYKNGGYLDTLAAAYAEVGLRRGGRVAGEGAKAGDIPIKDMAAARKRLDLFKAKKPYRGDEFSNAERGSGRMPELSSVPHSPLPRSGCDRHLPRLPQRRRVPLPDRPTSSAMNSSTCSGDRPTNRGGSSTVAEVDPGERRVGLAAGRSGRGWLVPAFTRP